MDPWVILPQERARHMEQFASAGPVDGFITGAQARTFFMQSGLPPMMLAQVWGLADMNGDGKMDMAEFSVACKLINLKLKGAELPKTLPPQLLSSAHGGMVGGGMGPPNTLPLHSAMGGMGGMPGMMPGQMGMAGMGGMGGMMGMGMGGQMGMGGMPGQMMGMGGMGGMPGQMMGMGGMPGQPGMGMGMPGQMMPPAQMPGAIPPAQPTPVPVPAAAPTVTPAPAPVEWAIPQQKRVGYMAQFQANDKAKTGFLAAVQARGILLQTGLAQQTLATVWNLADIDKDGKLSVEEFIVAMHLCELGQKGEPLPDLLPISLVPPNLRRDYGAAVPNAYNAAVAPASSGVATPGSVRSGDGAASPASFEDRRRENWQAGQAELSRRRESLLEQQKQEKAERERKEREAAEQREKQKREAEARRQAELEARRQRELELQRVQQDQKRKAEEQRELARKEMERQRLVEWENSRKSELEGHRQRETEKVINLRAKKETMGAELEALKIKIEGLSTGIGDTRTGVTDVKTFIDGMRSSRDAKMTALNSLKAQLKEQNQRLLQVTQEKAKIESKNKVNQQRIEDGRVVELTDFDLKKEEKAAQVEELREQFNAIKAEEIVKKAMLEDNKKILNEHREKLKIMIETCKALHEGFDEKRREVRAEKNKKIRELTDPDHAWGGGEESPTFSGPNSPVVAVAAAAVAADPFSDPFSAPDVTEPAAINEFESFGSAEPAKTAVAEEPAAAAVPTDLTGYVQYKALYDYEARNPDELAFSVDDIIMVHPGQDHEPGWLGGQLNGKVGWFPESYAERVVENVTSSDQTLQPIVELPENGSDSSSFQEVPTAAINGDGEAEVTESVGMPAKAEADGMAAASESAAAALSERVVSIYPYSSEEPGDLVFDAGEMITVTAKAGDWWTGELAGRTGVFPFNYVEPAPEGEPAKQAEEPTVADVAQEAAQPAEKPKTGKREKSKKDKSGKKLELASVIAPYEATSKEQLSLAKGQMVIVRKKTETGWWQGELQAGGKGKKRAVGWFPASYVKLLGGEAAGKADAAEEKPAGNEEAAGGETYTALFDYAAQYEDELGFEAGDTITVLAKEEEAWWKGECRGKTGVFPSNYVEPATK